MQGSKIIPIRFVDSLGNPTDPNVDTQHAIPVMDLRLLNWSGPDLWTVDAAGSDVRALVDTGADFNYAQRDFVIQHGCPVQYDLDLHSATHVAQASSLHKCMLRFRHLALNVETDIVSAALRENSAYQIILGRLFFKLGRLTMDYRNGRFEFEIPAT